MPTLRQLEYLVALADLRHFGRAAQKCHATQPSLSQQLRALERRLGTKLVERGQSNVELTPIGREIAERARTILVTAQDIRDLARRAEEGIAGAIRFGVSPTLGPYLMSEVISALRQSEQNLTLYIAEGIPDEQALELARGQLDMLLAPLPIDGERLAIEPLFRERLRLVTAPDHPLAQLPVIRTGDLAGTRVLSLQSSHHLHRQVAGLCVEHQMVLMRDYAGTSLDSLRQMAATGLAATFLPELYIRSEVGGTAGVVVLEVEGWRPTRSIAAAWREGAAYGQSFQAIAEYIRGEALAIIGE